MSLLCRRVNVYSCRGKVELDKIDIPKIFLTKIKANIINFVYSNMSRNKRQPYAVNKNAGNLTSALSWGTGRAVSRIPRISGSGTHRSGQGAVVNMCRGGRIFGPTVIWRKWHHKINKNQKKQAMLTAIAASAVFSLVAARGYNLKNIPELPFVVETSLEFLKKTKNARKFIVFIGNSGINKKKVRSGKGKMRNRRFLKRKSPLLVCKRSIYSFFNIPNVEICCLDSLSLFKLAPGGHIGRMCVWTFSCFVALNKIFKISSNINFKLNEKH